jgi:hypothetical protein
MNPRIIGRIVTILIFAALSYLLTTNLASGNILGVVFAIIALAATITFLWLWPKLYQREEEEA